MKLVLYTIVSRYYALAGVQETGPRYKWVRVITLALFVG